MPTRRLSPTVPTARCMNYSTDFGFWTFAVRPMPSNGHDVPHWAAERGSKYDVSTKRGTSRSTRTTSICKRRKSGGKNRPLNVSNARLARDHDTHYEVEWQPVDDDVLKLVFIACHPVLSTESQVAFTLRVVGGLSTTEIARLLLASVSAVQARITRAKRTLGEAAIAFDVPDPHEWPERLTAVLGVIYLIFTEGYAATSGPELIRHELAREALRLGRVLAGLLPREPEVHGLHALMEFQASRF